MSTFNDIDIECPECGEKYRGTVWVGVHAGQDPELKDLLLGGELNLVSCPECAQVAFQEHFLIYQEPAADLVAYVYPEGQRESETELRRLMLSGFQEAQGQMPAKYHLDYEPVLMFGLESLIELLEREIEIAEQSQIAQLICKVNQIATFVLRPYRARQLETVRVLPVVGDKPVPEGAEVIAGIDRLLSLNPALDLYAQLRDRIKADANWSLDSDAEKAKL